MRKIYQKPEIVLMLCGLNSPWLPVFLLIYTKTVWEVAMHWEIRNAIMMFGVNDVVG